LKLGATGRFSVVSPGHSKLHSRADTDHDVFSGDIWLGEEAVSLGLVDGIGDPRQVLRAEFGEDVVLRPVDLRPQLPWPFSAMLPESVLAGVGSGQMSSDCEAATAAGEAAGEATVAALHALYHDEVVWGGHRFY